MKLFVDFFEMWIGDMGVNLRGSNISVTEQALNRTDVSAVHEEIGGKTMAQSMGSDVFSDTGKSGVFADDAFN